jgi:hypothetical protein
MTSNTTLTYQVYVAPIIAMAGNDVPPGQSRSTWSPMSATRISGQHDAVLVDPLMTVEQGMAVADWVSTTGKSLTTVYVTHGTVTTGSGLGASASASPASAPSQRLQSSRDAQVVRARGNPGVPASPVPGPDPRWQSGRRSAGRAVVRA